MAWSTARKNNARDNSERLGRVQMYVMSSWIYPTFAALVVVLALGIVGGLESR